MTQNAKIKSAFCKLRPETFTVRNILSEGPEVQSPWASDCLIRAPVIIPKTASGESNILCVKVLKGEVLPRRHTTLETLEDEVLRRGRAAPPGLGGGRL